MSNRVLGAPALFLIMGLGLAGGCGAAGPSRAPEDFVGIFGATTANDDGTCSGVTIPNPTPFVSFDIRFQLGANAPLELYYLGANGDPCAYEYRVSGSKAILTDPQFCVVNAVKKTWDYNEFTLSTDGASLTQLGAYFTDKGCMSTYTATYARKS